MEDIIKGDTFSRTISMDDYSASEYDLHIALRGPDAIDIKTGEAGVTIAADGDDFDVTVTAAVTAGWADGEYWYSIYAGKTSWAERYEAERGTLKILENRGAVSTSNYTDKTHAKTVLDNIEAVIEGRAELDQMSYTIAGRRLDKTPLGDLLKLRNYYKALVVQEKRKERGDRGDAPGNLIKVKF